MQSKLSKWVAIAFLVLLLNTAYIAAFAEASVFYMGNVLLHLVLGLALSIAVVVLIARNTDLRRNISTALGFFLVAFIAAVYLVAAGNVREHRWVLWVHIVTALQGVVALIPFAWKQQRFRPAFQIALAVLLLFPLSTYVMPGERFPRRAITTDSIDLDAQTHPHSENGENGFALVGEILSDATNPGRKKPFDIRKVMMAAIDQDLPPLERWAGMRAAETAVVWDAHLGGYPICLIGIESRSVPRLGFIPADGPDQWSAGTLFPQSSKKVARAINASSNNRPVVVLANLSGFDGSPESMRRLQLEYGAEIGRAVVNFKGPIVFCVISRYHGGAYVVFSRALNEQLEVAALEETYASVIGGAPAAAVVFAGEVDARARKDPRLQELTGAMAQAEGAEKGRLRAQWEELFKVVHSEKLGEMAAEFDRVHSVQRALAVGALNYIIPPANLRPYLIDAVERGMGREEEAKSEKPRVQAEELEKARVQAEAAA